MRVTGQVEWFGNKVVEAKLRWCGHVQRGNSEYIGQNMITMELTGRRKRTITKEVYAQCRRLCKGLV